MRIIIYIALIIAVVIPLFAQSGVTDISLEELTDGSGLVRICYRARDMFDSTLAVNVQARWADSITWHIPVLTLFDTLSGYAMPNFGWRVNVDSIGLDHCFLWDMTTDLGSVEAKGFVARIVTFDSIVSRFNVVDSFQVSDSLRPELRAFGLGYRRGQLWVLYHNESTHDCWVRPYSLPELIEGDSLYIGTVTVGPSDMAFAGDRLFWVEDTRLLLKEFDFSTGTSRTVRGDWWGLPYTSTHIAGCAFDGQNLWVCFAEGAFVSLDTSDFSLVDTMFFSDFSTATPSTSADGLAWGLGLLWCYSNDNKVYAIDVETDSIIVSIPTGDVVLETGAEGAAWDGMNLWVVDYARGHVYKLLLYNQISIYISDNFILDNVPPTIEWLNPSLPDYSDSFITDDTSEISWSVRDSNLYGGTSVLLIDTDTLSEFPSVEMSFLWPTNPWPAYHGNFTIFITDSFGNNTSSTSPEFVIVPPAGISETILPSDFLLSAYPNPFNSAVTISYDCSVGEGLAPSRVEIFDFAGRMVAQLPSPSVPLP
ncbi:MAG: hypothetical protein KAG97_00285, partial [Victivallales bacterium]|nr:hypothetical protein [Victivallales bacterium]